MSSDLLVWSILVDLFFSHRHAIIVGVDAKNVPTRPSELNVMTQTVFISSHIIGERLLYIHSSKISYRFLVVIIDCLIIYICFNFGLTCLGIFEKTLCLKLMRNVRLWGQ
jgi:hypothetical protein